MINAARPCLIALVLLGGCVSNEAPTEQLATAGVGDVVLRAQTSEPLPNAFGGADIFGRTRPTGNDTLQFAGMNGNQVVFLRTSVAIQSNATTMSETPRYVQQNQFVTFSGYAGGQRVFGTGTVMGPGVVVPPSGSQTVSSQLPTIRIEVDWRSNPVVTIAGRRLVIHSATATTLTYSID